MTDNNNDQLELENAKLRLKVQALAERISEMAGEHESRVADLRVEITLLSQRLDSQEEANGEGA